MVTGRILLIHNRMLDYKLSRVAKLNLHHYFVFCQDGVLLYCALQILYMLHSITEEHE